ncbi:hypothetical protein RHMOL_Rhmol06G0111500 [Rhododendron molle]|uniref:Uncharacterized protein n=1 Tax=Rhododendron molle TaxID=49168 RepID=A0ACC0NB64_RHOML|nr:hypothetical protein RHMOL_Rhmol06G0111500 [Rhododendron molle]
MPNHCVLDAQVLHLNAQALCLDAQPLRTGCSKPFYHLRLSPNDQCQLRASVRLSSKLQHPRLSPHDCNRLRASVPSFPCSVLKLLAPVPPISQETTSNSSPEDGLDPTPITSIPSSSFARIGYSTELFSVKFSDRLLNFLSGVRKNTSRGFDASTAGQALLRASNQVELLVAERTRYRDDIKTERDKAKSLKNSLKLAKAKIAELEKERDEALENAKKAERELGQVLRRKKRKMKEVDEKAYQADFDRAGAEYMRDAQSMVNDEVKLRVPVSY